MEPARPIRRSDTVTRRLLSATCVVLALASFLLYRRDQEGRARVRALARRFTLDQRRPADAETLPLAPAEDLAAGVFANAVLRDAVEPASLAGLSPELRAAWLGALEARDEELAAARGLMLQGLARRPGWAYHAFLLATLTYVADTRRGDAVPGDDRRRWEPALRLAAAQAPRDDAIFAFWAAAYLERWTPAQAGRRREFPEILARAFTSPAFVATHFPAGVAALGRSEALALVPAEVGPLRAAADALARDHDLEGLAAALTRLGAAESAARERDLRRLEERARLGDVRSLSSGCVRFFSDHPIRELDDAQGRADAARLLALWPTERPGEWKSDPRGEAIRFFLEGREGAVPGATLAQAASALTGVPDDVLARIRLEAGDLRGAMALALDSASADSFAWTPFFVRLAAWELRSGRRDAAREALARIVPAARDGCDVLLVRRALAHASGETGEERRLAERIAALRPGKLSPDSWSASGSVSLCIDPERDASRELVVDVVGREPALVEFGWDGGRRGTLLVAPAGRIRLPLREQGGRHVVFVRRLAGGPVELSALIAEGPTPSLSGTR
jgi:hypothetical protein